MLFRSRVQEERSRQCRSYDSVCTPLGSPFASWQTLCCGLGYLLPFCFDNQAGLFPPPAHGPVSDPVDLGQSLDPFASLDSFRKILRYRESLAPWGTAPLAVGAGTGQALLNLRLFPSRGRSMWFSPFGPCSFPIPPRPVGFYLNDHLANFHGPVPPLSCTRVPLHTGGRDVSFPALAGRRYSLAFHTADRGDTPRPSYHTEGNAPAG